MILSVAMVLIMALPVSAASDFPDMKDHWAAESVRVLTGKNIIAGWGGLFHPEDTVKANEYIKMVVTALGYTDIQNYPGDWARNYVEKAMELGLVFNGEVANYNEPINRGMMAKIAMRALQDENTPDYIMAYKGLVSDYDDLNASIRLDALKCIEKGIIKGMPDGSFKPKDNSTRAEAATVIHRMISQEEREKAKPIFATPDPEFEAFMASPEAIHYCTIQYGKPVYKVIDGKIIFEKSIGETLLPAWHNKDANKEVYELVKNLVMYAKDNGHHVRLHLSDDLSMIFIDYYENEFYGLHNTSTYSFNFTVVLDLHPYKFREEQNEYSFYTWHISNLAKQDTEDWAAINYRDEDMTKAVEIAFMSVYGADLGQKMFDYAIGEYDTERDMYFNQGEKKYINKSIEYRKDLGGLEISNYNGEGSNILFTTNKK